MTNFESLKDLFQLLKLSLFLGNIRLMVMARRWQKLCMTFSWIPPKQLLLLLLSLMFLLMRL